MDAVIPWTPLLALIALHYPKAGRGRQPLGLEKMLRLYFVQQWFNLSDPQAEGTLYDSESVRRFVGVELSEDVVPDETTILPLSAPAGAAPADGSHSSLSDGLPDCLRSPNRPAANACLGWSRNYGRPICSIGHSTYVVSSGTPFISFLKLMVATRRCDPFDSWLIPTPILVASTARSLREPLITRPVS